MVSFFFSIISLLEVLVGIQSHITFLGGQSTSILSVEPEYSLPQNSIQGLDASSVDRLRRGPPEPYASSAIYTELNFKVCAITLMRTPLLTLD